MLGLGHLISHMVLVFSPRAKPPVVQAMQEFIVLMPGRKIDLLSLHHGFSLMMGILFVAFGGMSLFFPKMDTSFPSRSAPVIGLCLGVSVITLAVSVKFFFIVPVFFSLLSLVSFGAAMALNKRLNKAPEPTTVAHLER